MSKLTKFILPAIAGIMLLNLSPDVAAKNKYEKELEKEKGAVNLVREVLRGAYGVVTTGELKDMIDSGKEVLIIDAMPHKAYKKRHIPGARQFLFPVPEMNVWNGRETDGKTPADYAALLGADKNRTIVVYCGFVKCTRSHNAALWAKKLGYKHVYRYPGGIYAWQGAKFKTGEVK